VAGSGKREQENKQEEKRQRRKDELKVDKYWKNISFII